MPQAAIQRIPWYQIVGLCIHFCVHPWIQPITDVPVADIYYVVSLKWLCLYWVCTDFLVTILNNKGLLQSMYIELGIMSNPEMTSSIPGDVWKDV